MPTTTIEIGSRQIDCVYSLHKEQKGDYFTEYIPAYVELQKVIYKGRDVSRLCQKHWNEIEEEVYNEVVG